MNSDFILRGDFLQIGVSSAEKSNESDSRLHNLGKVLEKSKWRATFLSYKCFQSRSTSLTAVDCNP